MGIMKMYVHAYANQVFNSAQKKIKNKQQIVSWIWVQIAQGHPNQLKNYKSSFSCISADVT